MSFFNARFRDRNLSFTHVKPVEGGDLDGQEAVILRDPLPAGATPEHGSSSSMTTSTAIPSKATHHLFNIAENDHESTTSESNDEFASASEGEDDIAWGQSSSMVVDSPVLLDDTARVTTASITTTSGASLHHDVPDMSSATTASYSQSDDAIVPSLSHAREEASRDMAVALSSSTAPSSSEAPHVSFSAHHHQLSSISTPTVMAATTTTTTTASTTTYTSFVEGADKSLASVGSPSVIASAGGSSSPRSSRRVSYGESKSTTTIQSAVISMSSSSQSSSASVTPTPSRPSTSLTTTRSTAGGPAPRLRERMRQSPVPKSKIVRAYIDPSGSAGEGEQLLSPTSVRQAWLQEYPDATVDDEPSNSVTAAEAEQQQEENAQEVPVLLQEEEQTTYQSYGMDSFAEQQRVYQSVQGTEEFAGADTGLHHLTEDHSRTIDSTTFDMNTTLEAETKSGWGFEVEELEELEPMDVDITASFAPSYSHDQEEGEIETVKPGGHSFVSTATDLSSFEEQQAQRSITPATTTASSSDDIIPTLGWSQLMAPSSSIQAESQQRLEQQQHQQQPVEHQLQEIEDSWGLDDLEIEESALAQHPMEELGETIDDFAANVVEEESVTIGHQQHRTTSLITQEPDIPLPGPTTTAVISTATTTITTTSVTMGHLSTSRSPASVQSTLDIQTERDVEASWGFDMEDIDAVAMPTSTVAGLVSSMHSETPLSHGSSFAAASEYVSAAPTDTTASSSSLTHFTPETEQSMDASAEASWGFDMEDMGAIEVVTPFATASTSVSAIDATTTIQEEQGSAVTEQGLTTTSDNATFLSMISAEESYISGAEGDIEASWGLDEEMNLDLSLPPISSSLGLPASELERVFDNKSHVAYTEPGSAPAAALGTSSTLTPENTPTNFDVVVTDQVMNDVGAAWGFDETVGSEPMELLAISSTTTAMTLDVESTEATVQQPQVEVTTYLQPHNFTETVEDEHHQQQEELMQQQVDEPQSGFEEHAHEVNPIDAEEEEAPAPSASAEIMAEGQVYELEHEHLEQDRSYPDDHESDDSSLQHTSRVSLDSVNAMYDNEVRNVLFSDNDTPVMAVQDSIVHEHDNYMCGERISSDSSDEDALPIPGPSHGHVFLHQHHMRTTEGTPEPMNGFSSPHRSGGSSSTPLETATTTIQHSVLDENGLATTSPHDHAYGYEELYTTTVVAHDHGDSQADADVEDSDSDIMRDLSTARMARSRSSSNRLNETMDDDNFLEHMERGVPMDRPIATPEGSQSEDERQQANSQPSRYIEDNLVDLLERGETGPSPPTSSHAMFSSHEAVEVMNVAGGDHHHEHQETTTTDMTSGLLLTVKTADIQEDDDQRSLAVETSGSPISTIESVSVTGTGGGTGEDMERMEQDTVDDDQMSMIVETSTISSFDSRSVAVTAAVTLGFGRRSMEDNGSASAGLSDAIASPPTEIDARDELVPVVDGIPISMSALLAGSVVDAAVFEQQVAHEQRVQGLLDQEEEAKTMVSNSGISLFDDISAFEEGEMGQTEVEVQRQVVQAASECSTSSVAATITAQRHETASALFETFAEVEQRPEQREALENSPANSLANESHVHANAVLSSTLFSDGSAPSHSESFETTAATTIAFSLDQTPVSTVPSKFDAKDSHDVSDLFNRQPVPQSQQHQTLNEHLLESVPQATSHPFSFTSTSSPEPSAGASAFFAITPSRSPAPAHHDHDVAIPFLFSDAADEPTVVPSPPIPKRSPNLDVPQTQLQEQEQQETRTPPQVTIADMADDTWNDDDQLLQEPDQMLEEHNAFPFSDQVKVTSTTSLSSSSPQEQSRQQQQEGQHHLTSSATLSPDLTTFEASTTMAISIERQQCEGFANILFSPPSQRDPELVTTMTRMTTTTIATSLVEQAIAEDEEEAVFEIATTSTTTASATAEEQISTLLTENSPITIASTHEQANELTTALEGNQQAADHISEAPEGEEGDGWGQEDLDIAVEDIVLNSPIHAAHVQQQQTQNTIVTSSDVAIVGDNGDEADQADEEDEKALADDREDFQPEGLAVWSQDPDVEFTELQDLQLDHVLEEQAAQLASLEHPEGSGGTGVNVILEQQQDKELDEMNMDEAVATADDAWALNFDPDDLSMHQHDHHFEDHHLCMPTHEFHPVVETIVTAGVESSENVTGSVLENEEEGGEAEAAPTLESIDTEQQHVEQIPVTEVVATPTASTLATITEDYLATALTTSSSSVSVELQDLEGDDTAGDGWEDEIDLDLNLTIQHQQLAEAQEPLPEEDVSTTSFDQDLQQQEQEQKDSQKEKDGFELPTHTIENVQIEASSTERADDKAFDIRDGGVDSWGQEGLEFEIQATSSRSFDQDRQQAENNVEELHVDTAAETVIVHNILTTTAEEHVDTAVDATAANELDAWDVDDDAWEQDDIVLQTCESSSAVMTSSSTTKAVAATEIIEDNITIDNTPAVEILESKGEGDVGVTATTFKHPAPLLSTPLADFDFENDAWDQDEELDLGIGEPIVQQQQQEDQNVKKVDNINPEEDNTHLSESNAAQQSSSSLQVENDDWSQEEIVIHKSSMPSPKEEAAPAEEQGVECAVVSEEPEKTCLVPPVLLKEEDNQQQLMPPMELTLEEDAWGLDTGLPLAPTTIPPERLVSAESAQSVVSVVHETSESAMMAVEHETIAATDHGWGFDDEDLQIEQQSLEMKDGQRRVQQSGNYEPIPISSTTAIAVGSSISLSVTPPPRPELLLKESGGTFSAQSDNSDAKMEPVPSSVEKVAAASTRKLGERSAVEKNEEEEEEENSSWQDISPASVAPKRSVTGSEIESEYLVRSIEEHRSVSVHHTAEQTSSFALSAIAMEPSLSWTDLKHEHESSGEWQHDSVESVDSDKKDEASLDDLLKDSGDGWGDMDDGLAPLSTSATSSNSVPAATFSSSVDVPSRNNTPSPSIYLNRLPTATNDYSLSPTSPTSTSSIVSATSTTVAAVGAAVTGAAAVAAAISEEEEDDSHLPQAIRKQRARLRAMGKPLPSISKYTSSTTNKAAESSPSSSLNLAPKAASTSISSATTPESKSTYVSPALQKQRERLEKKRAAAAAAKALAAATSTSTSALTTSATITSNTSVSSANIAAVGRSSLVATLSSPVGPLNSMRPSSPGLGHAAGHGILSPRLSTESRPSMDDLHRSSRRGSAASSSSILGGVPTSPSFHARHVHHHHHHHSPMAESGGGIISRKSKDLERRTSASLSLSTLGTAGTTLSEDTVEVVHSSEADIHGHTTRSSSKPTTTSISLSSGGWEIESHWEEEHQSTSSTSESAPQTPLHSRYGPDRRSAGSSSGGGFGPGVSASSSSSSGWGSLSGNILGMSKSMEERQQRTTISNASGNPSSFFNQSVPSMDATREGEDDGKDDGKGDDNDRYGSKKVPPSPLSLSSSSSSANTAATRGTISKSSSSSWSLGSWVSSAVAVASSAVDRAYESLDPEYSRMKQGMGSPEVAPQPRPGYVAGGSSLAMGQASILTAAQAQQQQRERSMSSSSGSSSPQPYPHPHAHLQHHHHLNSPNLSRKSYNNNEQG